jgi:hypothetical protein
VSSGRTSCGDKNTTGARASKPRALVVRRHHLLVQISHWLTIPLLLGLILSGLSIYWASPIYQHDPNPTTGSFDYFADAGIWICAHLPWLHHHADPANWVYNHGSLGPSMLAFALRFHWFCAYLRRSFFFDRRGAVNNLQFTGDDFFADKDVCSIVLEVPNFALGGQSSWLWHHTLLRADGTGGGWILPNAIAA